VAATMAAMHAPTRALAAAAAITAALVAACAAPAPTPASTPARSASAVAVRTATPTAAPTAVLTPVPQPSTSPTEPAAPTDAPGGGTTKTDWGTILDHVPEGFPVFPGAEPAELPDGPNSGAWSATGDVDAVATWYRTKLEELGFTTKDLSSPLEDGSRVLDTVSDLPECRIQTTFRPADGSTMIVVLYGAGCAGGEG
jgi:hypothetical protein